MEHVNILSEYGLFDAKVPRYTSYPPANRFEPNIGARMQAEWLAQVPRNVPVSVYVHIPFCRRLCWFCACRTQGTKTLQPVDAYINDLEAEIGMAAEKMNGKPRMSRLHLGGGTPTLLNVAQMTRVLDALDNAFVPASDFEFSVEIDPTEASPEILEFLACRGLTRASIGVQDFEPQVQEAIGRKQSFAQTSAVVEQLRRQGVTSLNFDLLYGLPYQTAQSLQKTLRHVFELRPDRLALYGYAHVPHMSKRQIMIVDETLPSNKDRYFAAQSARDRLISEGYTSIGIDHFARPTDSLAKAERTKKLKRNFQGYTDDPCSTLIGFGASAISKFEQGFSQNSVATSAYRLRIGDKQLAGHKGYFMSPEDLLISDFVEQIMCYSEVNLTQLIDNHPQFAHEIHQISQALNHSFPNAIITENGVIKFREAMAPLTRIVAAQVDRSLQINHRHSVAF